MSATSPPEIWTEIARRISAATGSPPPSGSPLPIRGGCIHRTFVFGSSPKFFVKTNTSHFADAFSSECDALRAIAATGTISVPHPIATGTVGTCSFLALSFVEMHPLSPSANALLGSHLASLHRHTSPDRSFGWHRENTIGATTQPNTPSSDWASFFCQFRLGFQFHLAAHSGHRFPGDSQFLDKIHSILSAHSPPPSLLHGDLWAGNAAADPDQHPVIFDPASYFGDRETDLAFTRLFGGFSNDFYTAYLGAWPLPDGHTERVEIYNIYHILNHFHLFGGGYADQARAIMKRFL